MAYGVKSEAAELSGLSESAFTDEMLEQVDNFINLELNQSTSFGVQTERVEYFNINERNNKEIMLAEIPVSEVSEIVNDAQASPKVINLDCFFIDNSTGIISIVSDVKNLTSGNIIYCFTIGTKSVKVTYEYGFDTVPNDIVKFANLLLAKWAEVNDTQADSDGLTSIAIGDYRESFDSKFMGVETKYDSMIKDSLKLLKGKYAKGV